MRNSRSCTLCYTGSAGDSGRVLRRKEVGQEGREGVHQSASARGKYHACGDGGQTVQRAASRRVWVKQQASGRSEGWRLVQEEVLRGMSHQPACAACSRLGTVPLRRLSSAALQEPCLCSSSRCGVCGGAVGAVTRAVAAAAAAAAESARCLRLVRAQGAAGQHQAICRGPVMHQQLGRGAEILHRGHGVGGRQPGVREVPG